MRMLDRSYGPLFAGRRWVRVLVTGEAPVDRGAVPARRLVISALRCRGLMRDQ
jgi:hypothetical protein